MWSPPSDQPDFLQSALPAHDKVTNDSDFTRHVAPDGTTLRDIRKSRPLWPEKSDDAA